MKPTYFDGAAAFRSWLESHHATASEVLVGFHKVRGGAGSTAPMTWQDAVDEALCFGWIDGVRRRVDDRRYTVRFTPRKPASRWSAANLRRVEELKALGRLHPAGFAAYEARDTSKGGGYSYELADAPTLDADAERAFRGNDVAWTFFHAQAPSYRRAALHWVTSAKRPETRERRLATLIEDSAAGRRLAHLDRRR